MRKKRKKMVFPFLAHLDEDPHVLQVFSMPLVKGLQQLQTVTGGVYIYLYGTTAG